MINLLFKTILDDLRSNQPAARNVASLQMLKGGLASAQQGGKPLETVIYTVLGNLDVLGSVVNVVTSNGAATLQQDLQGNVTKSYDLAADVIHTCISSDEKLRYKFIHRGMLVDSFLSACIRNKIADTTLMMTVLSIIQVYFCEGNATGLPDATTCYRMASCLKKIAKFHLGRDSMIMDAIWSIMVSTDESMLDQTVHMRYYEVVTAEWHCMTEESVRELQFAESKEEAKKIVKERLDYVFSSPGITYGDIKKIFDDQRRLLTTLKDIDAGLNSAQASLSAAVLQLDNEHFVVVGDANAKLIIASLIPSLFAASRTQWL